MTRLERLELLEEAAWAVHTHKIEAVGFTLQELQEAGEANVLSEIRNRGARVALTTEPEPSVVQEEKPTYLTEEIKDE
jgi:vancomycin permeability regulator SanA